MSAGLHSGIGAKALHVVIDMQELFDSHPDWGVADLRRILPQVLRLASAYPQRTLYTRFVPPHSPEEAAPSWQRYYHFWRNATLDRTGLKAVDLVPELAALPTAGVIDKGGYSAYSSPDFAPLLQRLGADTLIFSGVETDVCVWATVLAAIDHGLRVIIATDAVTSGDIKAHEMVLQLAADRFSQQIELARVDEICAAWQP
ncbi:MAG TPA: cysteine hydrolase [Terriglobales bacterium]|nr:cysteine hydrolase [Terriglobales bacterium]